MRVIKKTKEKKMLTFEDLEEGDVFVWASGISVGDPMRMKCGITAAVSLASGILYDRVATDQPVTRVFGAFVEESEPAF